MTVIYIFMLRNQTVTLYVSVMNICVSLYIVIIFLFLTFFKRNKTKNKLINRDFRAKLTLALIIGEIVDTSLRISSNIVRF